MNEITPRDALRVWIRIALQSFGGPAGQIAVMHRVLVEEKRWVSEERFLHALSYCMLLPGPEAQQLATYIGWLLHGTRGGLVAGSLFVLPGFLSILVLSVVYAHYGHTTVLQALFFGLKAAVLAVVVEAVLRIGRRAVRGGLSFLLAIGAFIAVFLFEVGFPWVVLVAGLLGFALRDRLPPVVPVAAGEPLRPVDAVVRPAPTTAGSARVALVWMAIWFAPIAAVALALGPDHVITRAGLFFSKVAALAFGGAYAVLAYVAQHAVERLQWLAPSEMLDGLGMAETTPGPLITVVQFVGFLAAFRNPGPLSPTAAGILASVVVCWATFAPSFLWIFLGAPYAERVRGKPRLASALSGVTAAVVGVILNLAAWFALHTLFGRVSEGHAGPVRIFVPKIDTLDLGALVLSLIAFVALLRLRWGMLPTLGVCCALGLIYKLAF